jgi:hypothetical protein
MLNIKILFLYIKILYMIHMYVVMLYNDSKNFKVKHYLTFHVS